MDHSLIDSVSDHDRHIRDITHRDAVQFMQEQRIRCLTQGAWFALLSRGQTERSSIKAWRYVRLAANRRHLQYATYSSRRDEAPPSGDLTQTIDVDNISSVVSNVTTEDLPSSTRTELQAPPQETSKKSTRTTITKLTIHGSVRANAVDDEAVLLELHTGDSILASEWLDGLLMLLDQQPITAETNKLINLIGDWSLKVRLLNLQWDDADWGDHQDKPSHGKVTVPTREGLDSNYWYDMGER